MIEFFSSVILWDHHRICRPSFTETSLCGAWLYYDSNLFGTPPWRSTIILWPMDDRNIKWELDENRNGWIPFQAEILGASIYFPFVMSSVFNNVSYIGYSRGPRGEDSVRKGSRPPCSTEGIGDKHILAVADHWGFRVICHCGLSWPVFAVFPPIICNFICM